jgi:hypothetical protein
MPERESWVCPVNAPPVIYPTKAACIYAAEAVTIDKAVAVPKRRVREDPLVWPLPRILSPFIFVLKLDPK